MFGFLKYLYRPKEETVDIINPPVQEEQPSVEFDLNSVFTHAMPFSKEDLTKLDFSAWTYWLDRFMLGVDQMQNVSHGLQNILQWMDMSIIPMLWRVKFYGEYLDIVHWIIAERGYTDHRVMYAFSEAYIVAICFYEVTPSNERKKSARDGILNGIINYLNEVDNER